jgi:hypothetical protein
MKKTGTAKKNNSSGYDWIHPSWRDLVIEHLRDDAVMRSDFLSKCSINGVLLALSMGGGKAGERSLPLLACSHDWSNLKNRVSELVKREDCNKHLDLINSVLNLLRRPDITSASENSNEIHSAELLGFASGLLSDCRSEWDLRMRSLKPRLLDSYYLLSMYFSPLPASPDLSATWQSCYSLFVNEINSYKLGDELDENVFQEFFSFIGICSANEPRFLRQVDYPQLLQSQVVHFIDQASGELIKSLEVGPEDDMQGEIYRLESIEKACDSINFFPDDLLSKADELASDLSSRKDALEQLMLEVYSNDPIPSSIDDRSRPEQFSLDELFADL